MLVFPADRSPKSKLWISSVPSLKLSNDEASPDTPCASTSLRAGTLPECVAHGFGEQF